MSEKELPLVDGLREIISLAKKYKFTEKDFILLADRILLLGEAIMMIQDLGLFLELSKRHEKKCEIASKVMYPER